MTDENIPGTDQPRPDTEQRRREIEATRDDMGRTVAEIEDRVSPSRIKERQTQKVRSKWTQLRESIMGSSDSGSSSSGPSTRDRVSGAAEGAQETVQHAPERVESMTRGNPLAAGLVAMGLGALAGTVFPASRAERRLATELRDEFEEPLREQVQNTGKEMQGELKEHAQQAVKDTIVDTMSDTKDTAQQAVQEVSSSAKDAGQSVKES